MELVTVKSPAGTGVKMAELAFQAGISEVNISEGKVIRKDRTESVQDIFEFQTKTPNAKKFLEQLMSSSFYDPGAFSFITRLPESIFGSERPEDETMPFVRPTTDVYQESWQFLRITKSLIVRVFLSAFLLSYGMKEAFMPLIIAGLLFLPYHHHLLGIALGGSLMEWRLLRQGIYSFLLATALIILGGVVVGLLPHSEIKFTAFAETSLYISFMISTAIGVAAGFAAMDDAGRRELIGLAATAHLAVYPAWFGMKFLLGFDPTDKPMDFLVAFGMDVITITFFAALTFKLMKMKGEGIREFVKVKEKES